MNARIINGKALLEGSIDKAFQSVKRIVLVGGCFDILHYGHLVFLQKAKSEGDMLVIALEPDDFIQSRKKRKAFHTQEQRAEVLTHLRSVDAVIMLPSMQGREDYIKLVEVVRPAVIAVTAGDPMYENKKNLGALVGAKVVEVIGKLDGFSSSQILQHANILYD